MNFKKASLALSAVVFVFFLLPQPASAVDIVDNKRICSRGNAGGSTVCQENKVSGNPIFGPGGVLTIIINLLTIIVGIAAVIAIILGGLKFVTSGSNPEDVKNARERVIYAVVALLIAALAQLFVRFIAGQVAT